MGDVRWFWQMDAVDRLYAGVELPGRAICPILTIFRRKWEALVPEAVAQVGVGGSNPLAPTCKA